MNRQQFIKKTILATLGIAFLPSLFTENNLEQNNNLDYSKKMTVDDWEKYFNEAKYNIFADTEKMFIFGKYGINIKSEFNTFGAINYIG